MGLEFESPAGHQKSRYPCGVSAFLIDGDSNDINAARMSAARCGWTQRNLYFRQRRKCKRFPYGSLPQSGTVRTIGILANGTISLFRHKTAHHIITLVAATLSFKQSVSRAVSTFISGNQNCAGYINYHSAPPGYRLLHYIMQ